MNWEVSPDCGGIIQEVAITLHKAYLHGPTFQAKAIRQALKSVVSALPENVVVYVVSDAEEPDVANWFPQKPAGTFHVVSETSAKLRRSTFWTQDPLLVQNSGDNVRLSKIKADRPGRHARVLAEHLGHSYLKNHIFLPGGDHIIGKTFRLIGRNSLNKTASQAQISSDQAMTLFEWIDPKPIYLWQHSDDALLTFSHVASLPYAPLPSGSLPAIKNKDFVEWHKRLQEIELEPAELYMSLLSGGLKQFSEHRYEFHVDRLASATGCMNGEKEIILIADPVSPVDDYTEVANAFKKMLDRHVEYLEQTGKFKIVRNPIPFAVHPQKGELFPRLYNNVLLENQPRNGHDKPIVWLPCFGENPLFTDFDDRNARIWENLGFEVHRVHGFEDIAYLDGALRCICKVLRREQ